MSDPTPPPRCVVALSRELATHARGVLHRASILSTGDDALVLDVLGTLVELALGHTDEERALLLRELLAAHTPAVEAIPTTTPCGEA